MKIPASITAFAALSASGLPTCQAGGLSNLALPPFGAPWVVHAHPTPEGEQNGPDFIRISDKVR